MNHVAAERLEAQWRRLWKERHDTRERMRLLDHGRRDEELIARECRLSMALGDALRQVQGGWLSATGNLKVQNIRTA